MYSNNNTPDEQRIISRIACLNGKRDKPGVKREIAQLHRELERINPDKWSAGTGEFKPVGLQVTVTLSRGRIG